MRYFKALIPFSSNEGIFNPGDEKKAPKELVEAWIKAGIAAAANGPDEVQTSTKDNAKLTDDEIKRLEAVRAPEMLEGTIIPDKQEQAETKQDSSEKVDYSTLSYPQLKQMAKKAGIAKYNSMKQASLIEALQKGE